MITTLLIQVALAVITGGLAASIISFFANRKKTKSESFNLDTKSQTEIIQNMNEYSDRLEARMTKSDEAHEKKIDSLQAEVEKLRTENLELKRMYSDLYSKLDPEVRASVAHPPWLFNII